MMYSIPHTHTAHYIHTSAWSVSHNARHEGAGLGCGSVCCNKRCIPGSTMLHAIEQDIVHIRAVTCKHPLPSHEGSIHMCMYSTGLRVPTVASHKNNFTHLCESCGDFSRGDRPMYMGVQGPTGVQTSAKACMRGSCSDSTTLQRLVRRMQQSMACVESSKVMKICHSYFNAYIRTYHVWCRALPHMLFMEDDHKTVLSFRRMPSSATPTVKRHSIELM